MSRIINTPVTELEAVKIAFVLTYVERRLYDHGYCCAETHSFWNSNIRISNPKKGTVVYFAGTIREIELMSPPEPPHDYVFINRMLAEGVFVKKGDALVARLNRPLDELILAIRPFLSRSQLLDCVLAKPSTDAAINTKRHA